MINIKTTAERLREARGVGPPGEFYQAEIAELRAALNQTCGTCKHWAKAYEHLAHECRNIDIIDMIDTDYGGGFSFDPPADFGCNRWSTK